MSINFTDITNRSRNRCFFYKDLSGNPYYLNYFTPVANKWITMTTGITSSDGETILMEAYDGFINACMLQMINLTTTTYYDFTVACDGYEETYSSSIANTNYSHYFYSAWTPSNQYVVTDPFCFHHIIMTCEVTSGDGELVLHLQYNADSVSVFYDTVP